jgi:hypothetical protein
MASAVAAQRSRSPAPSAYSRYPPPAGPPTRKTGVPARAPPPGTSFAIRRLRDLNLGPGHLPDPLKLIFHEHLRPSSIGYLVDQERVVEEVVRGVDVDDVLSRNAHLLFHQWGIRPAAGAAVMLEVMSIVLAPEHPLWGAWAKVDRAGEHVEVLKEEFADWCNRYPDGLVIVPELDELDPATGEFIASVNFDVNPPAWGVRIGEFLHDLRTALNHLLVATSATPTAETQFPVAVTKGDYESCWPMVFGVPTPYLEVVKAAQPYESGNADLARLHPLRRLADLNNRDKHHLLLVTLLGLEDASGAYKSFWEHPRAESVEFRVGPAETDSEVAKVTFRSEGEKDVSRPSVGVVFEEPDVPSVHRLPVSLVLEEMLVECRAIVDAFFQIARTMA